MASAIRICYVFLPLLLAIGALILMVLNLTGSTRSDVEVTRNTYYLSITGPNGYAQFGPLNTCTSNNSDDPASDLSCKKPSLSFDASNFNSVLSEISGVSVSSSSADSSAADDAESSLARLAAKLVRWRYAFHAMVGLFLAATILSFLTVLGGLAAFASAGGSVFASCTALLASFCGFAGSAIATVIYKTSEEQVNTFAKSNDMTTTLSAASGNYGYGFAWGGSVILLLAFIWYLTSCCCPNGRRKQKVVYQNTPYRNNPYYG